MYLFDYGDPAPIVYWTEDQSLVS